MTDVPSLRHSIRSFVPFSLHLILTEANRFRPSQSVPHLLHLRAAAQSRHIHTLHVYPSEYHSIHNLIHSMRRPPHKRRKHFPQIKFEEIQSQAFKSRHAIVQQFQHIEHLRPIVLKVHSRVSLHRDRGRNVEREGRHAGDVRVRRCYRAPCCLDGAVPGREGRELFEGGEFVKTRARVLFSHRGGPNVETEVLYMLEDRLVPRRE